MVKNLSITAVVIASVLLSACGEPQKSQAYFQAHQDEIAPVLKTCQEKPGAVNCEAAQAADAIIKQQKWIATPPKRGVW